jgi:hypothetical protein
MTKHEKNFVSSIIWNFRIPKKVQAFILWAFITIVIAAVSCIVTEIIKFKDIAGIRDLLTKHLVIAALFGNILMWATILGAHKFQIETFFDPFHRASPMRIGIILCISMFVLGGLIFISAWIFHATSGRPLKTIFENPGGIFTIVCGFLTLWGVWLTVESLIDIKQTIHTFRDMIERVCELIKTTESNDRVKIVAYTPTTGCFAVQEPVWNKLWALLQSPEYSIDMVCLSMEDIKIWYQNYLSEINNQSKIDQMLQETDVIFKSFENLKSVDLKKLRTLKTRKWEQLPGFYIFCNRKKAIITTPFFMPNIKNGNILHKSGIGKPQMLGFETTQHHLVDAAERMFEYYFNDDHFGKSISVTH